MNKMNEKKVYVWRLGSFLSDHGKTMSGDELADHLNRNNFRWGSGKKYTGERGTYTLIGATWKWLNDDLGLPGESEKVALAFVKPDGSYAYLKGADIFKMNLYKNVADAKEQFVKNWKKLMYDDKKKDDNYDVMRLFGIYMHVLSAKEKDTGKGKNLSAYFLDRTRTRLGDPKTVMEHLKKCKDIDTGWKDITPGRDIWRDILCDIPHMDWTYPLYVFLFKYATYDKESKLTLDPQYQPEFIKLIKETARYVVIMGVATDTDHSIKTTIYNVCRDIAHGGGYHRRYRENSRPREDAFNEKLKNCDYGGYQRVLVLISIALHNLPYDRTNRRYEEFLGKLQNRNEELLKRLKKFFLEDEEEKP